MAQLNDSLGLRTQRCHHQSLKGIENYHRSVYILVLPNQVADSYKFAFAEPVIGWGGGEIG